MIALIILFIIALFARIMFGVFVDSVSFFSVLLTPMTWVCVGLGVLMIAFIIKTLFFKRLGMGDAGLKSLSV